jgi:uncharacterized protein (TIRG00374 family)
MSEGKKKTILKKYGFRFIGVILMIYVFSKVDWPFLGKALQTISIKSLLMVIPVFLLIFPVKAFRWFYILKTQRINITKSQAFGYYTAAIYWGLMTPGKLGEFIKVYYITGKGVSTGKAVFSVLMDRGVDISFILILSVVGVMRVLKVLSWPLTVVLLAAATALFMLIFKYVDIILKKCTPLIKRIAKKFKKNPETFIEELHHDIHRFSPGKIGIILVISVLSWVVYVVPLYLLGAMLHLDIPGLELVMGILLSSGVSMLPISIGGVGTRDSFLILYLGHYGVLKEKALVFSFMFIYIYLVTMIFTWIVYMMADIKKTTDRIK